MDKEKEIKELLSAYYAGMTTEEEEMRLKQYFDMHKDDMSDSLIEESRAYRAIHSPSAITMPKDFEKKLSDIIDAKAEEEKHFLRANRPTFSRKWIISIAASVLLIIATGIGTYLITDSREPEQQDTYQNPEQARKAATQALTDVSKTLNESLANLN
jgi:hypothetical protein